MSDSAAISKWQQLFRAAVEGGTLVKLTLGHYAGSDGTLKNVFVRPVALKAGLRLSFVYRHATKDITKNLTPAEGVTQVEALLGTEFRSAHLFTTTQAVQLEWRKHGEPKLTVTQAAHAAPASTGHDRARKRFIEAKGSAWLHAVGVTTTEGAVCDGMTAKFKQINKFVEVLEHLLADAKLDQRPALHLVDMGCGKGYLTFAAYDYLQRRGVKDLRVRGIEARPDLVALCNRVAQESGFAGLQFEAGTIANTKLEDVDVLIALHACDTATDDAMAKGIHAGASLIVAAPCCQKEVRPQLRAPEVLRGALQHGIFRERQAEFVTDALRAGLLAWAGYETKVFEFISIEHTGKNLMIAGIKRSQAGDREETEKQVQELAKFYGVKKQRLAELLGMSLRESTPSS